MDIQLPDGTILRGIPEGTTKSQIIEKLRNSGYDVTSLLAAETKQQSAPESIPFVNPLEEDFRGTTVGLGGEFGGISQEEYDKAYRKSKGVDLGVADALEKGFLKTALGTSKALGGASPETYRRAYQQAEEAAKQHEIATGIGGALPVIGAAVPAMFALPAVTAGMGALGTAATSVGLAGVPMGTVGGTSRYSEVLEGTGGDEAAALKAGIASGTMAALSAGLPMAAGGRVLGPSILGRAGEGAAINIGTGITDRAIQNALLSDYEKLHQDLLDPTSLAIEGVMGGIFGGISPAHIKKIAKPKLDADTNVPPPIGEVTEQQLTRLTNQKEQLTNYRSRLEEELVRAQTIAERKPSKAYLVENLERRIQEVDNQLASVDVDIETVQRGGKKPVVEQPPDSVEQLTTQYVEAKRRANEVSSKALSEGQAGRLTESKLLQTEAEALIKERDAIKERLIEATRLKQAQEGTVPVTEAPSLGGDVPPSQPPTTEAPKPPTTEGLTLSDIGKATSVQTTGTHGVVRTGDIKTAFDPAKVATWSDEAIGNAIASRVAKMEVEKSASVKANMEAELGILYAEQKNRGIDFSQQVPQFKTPPTTVAGLRTAVETGGWRAGLNHIIANLPADNLLQVISKTLLKNKRINTSISYLEDIKGLGGYSSKTGDIGINAIRAPDSATTFVHEVVHRGTSNAIDQFNLDPSKLTSRERKAINQLIKLFDSVKDLPRVVGTRPVSNLKEFLAYGLTHEGFQSWLNTQKGVSEKSLLRRLVDGVMELLGFDVKARTAYTELLGLGKTLISEARAINPQAELASIKTQLKRALVDQDINTILKYTQDQLIGLAQSGRISDIGNRLSSLYKNVFGKTQLKAVWDNPIINYVGEIVRRAEQQGIEFKNKIIYGTDPNISGNVGKRLLSLKRYVANNSVYKTFHDLSVEGAATLHDWNKKFFDEFVTVESIQKEMADAGLDPGMWFSYHLENRVKQLQDAGVNQKVIDAYISEKKAVNAALEDNNILLQKQGRSSIPIRPDYYPSVRKGRYAVSVFANDLLYRVQLFRTELEANLFKEKMGAFPDYKVTIEDTELTKAGIPNLEQLSTFTKDIFARLNIDPEIYGLSNVLDQMTTTGMKFGKHQLFRQGIEGYAGSEWFKTRAELGNAYREAIFNWAEEQASIRTKQAIKFNTERVLGDDVQSILPNAVNMARHIRDMGMNAVPEWGWAKAFDESVRNTSDGLIHNAAKLFGKGDYVPKISPIDKVVGVSSSIFYLTTLMPRAGFWIGQLLTGPSSIRHILRSVDVPLTDIFTSSSKGSLRTFGVVKYDKVSADVMQHLIANTTTLRPQLQNELNTIKWLSSGSGNKFVEVLRLISGQSPSEAADVISRVWTANMMIEHYRGMGLKGMELIDAVTNATDSTMVAYNRSNKAAWVGKSGIVGQAMNPLLTYGTAQLGNLVSDLHFMARQKTLRSALPALSTMLVTQLMAGAIGLPLLVEYQFLRDLLVGYDPDYDWMPDPKSILLNAPAVVERGIPSAVTGFDIGSGMRWNPFLANFFLEDNQSLIDAFPAIAFMGQVGKAAGLQLLNATGVKNVTDADLRKSLLGVTPFVGGKALTDMLYFDSLNRDYVPGGRSYAVVEQTPKENLATLFGSRTVEKARIQDADYIIKQRERALASKQQKLIDLVADQGKSSDSAISKLSDMGLTSEEIVKLVTEAMKARNTPVAIRWLQGGEGPAALRRKARLINEFGSLAAVGE